MKAKLEAEGAKVTLVNNASGEYLLRGNLIEITGMNPHNYIKQADKPVFLLDCS